MFLLVEDDDVLWQYPEVDRPLLVELLKRGVDLGVEREVVNYLYFRSLADQQGAGVVLGSAGWAVDFLDPDPQELSQSWVLIARFQRALLTVDAVRGNRELMEAVAAHFGGQYDGWEAALQPT